MTATKKPKRRKSKFSSKAAAGESKRTIAQMIRRSLEDDIIVGRLAPGERIDEIAIAKRFNASRTPVREALNSLGSSGLVEVKPRHGASVIELTIEKLIEMFDVMAALEGYCAKLAARRITVDELKTIKECNQTCRMLAEAGDAPGFYEKNNELHILIYRSSGNETLLHMSENLRRRLSPYRRHATYQNDRMMLSIAEHDAVIAAIERHAEVDAERLMREHISLLAIGFSDLVAALSKQVTPQRTLASAKTKSQLAWT